MSLWNPNNPPKTPNDLPNHMRPKTTGSINTRTPNLGHSKFLQDHFRKNNLDFPNIHSVYGMPEEQKKVVAIRNQLKKEREKEEMLALEQDEQIKVQMAHEQWISWYEKTGDRLKQQRSEIRTKNKLVAQEKQAKKKMRENGLIEQNLDYAGWCKTKETKIIEDRKNKKAEEQKIIDNSLTPLQKMKQNDKAFRRWLRKSNRRQREEAMLDRERERLRRIELRREAKAQKALAAIKLLKLSGLGRVLFIGLKGA